MFTKRNVKAVMVTKDMVADQTHTHIHEKQNLANLAFSSSRGLGTADTSTATGWLFGVGGFDDQHIEGVFRFIPPCVTASASLGPFLRCQTLDGNASYYWARIDNGIARISRIVSGSFSTLSSAAFSLPVEQDVRITFTAVGSVLSASFDAGGSPATVNLTAVDTLITGGGLMGARCLASSNIYCSVMTGSML